MRDKNSTTRFLLYPALGTEFASYIFIKKLEGINEINLEVTNGNDATFQECGSCRGDL